MTTRTEKTIFEELIEVQKELPVIAKSAKANYGKYADFDSIIKTVRPILNEHGLLLQQLTKSITTPFYGVVVETIITNGKGEKVSSGELTIPTGETRGSLAQASGAIITYAKRYSLSAFLGIATGEDTDGNLAPQSLPKTNSFIDMAKQKKAIEQKIANCKSLEDYQSAYAQMSYEERNYLVASGMHETLKTTLPKAEQL